MNKVRLFWCYIQSGVYDFYISHAVTRCFDTYIHEFRAIHGISLRLSMFGASATNINDVTTMKQHMLTMHIIKSIAGRPTRALVDSVVRNDLSTSWSVQGVVRLPTKQTKNQFPNFMGVFDNQPESYNRKRESSRCSVCSSTMGWYFPLKRLTQRSCSAIVLMPFKASPLLLVYCKKGTIRPLRHAVLARRCIPFHLLYIYMLLNPNEGYTLPSTETRII